MWGDLAEAFEVESVEAPSERPSESWAEPTDLVSSLEDFKTLLKEDLKDTVTDGPVGYLQRRLASTEQRKEFADYLVKAFPEKLDIGYTYTESARGRDGNCTSCCYSHCNARV